MLSLMQVYPSIGAWLWPAAAIAMLLPVYAWMRPIGADDGWNRRSAPRLAALGALFVVAFLEILAIGRWSAVLPNAGETAFALCTRAREAGECAAALAAGDGWGARIAATLWGAGLDAFGMGEQALHYRIAMSFSVVWLAAAAVPLWRGIWTITAPTSPAQSRPHALANWACFALLLAAPFGVSAHEHARMSDPGVQLPDIATMCEIDADIAGVADTLEGGHRMRAAMWAACARKTDRMTG